MIEAAIFDMDGLLIDSEPFWRKAEIEGFAEVGVHLSENDCRETMGYRLNEVVALWHQRKPWSGKSLAAVETDILSRVSQYIKLEGRPMPGALAAIALCRKSGLKTAIASSSPMILIESVVERFDLHNAFDHLHSAQFETHGKPHPAVFLSAAQALGISARQCMVFEDSFHGMVAGLAASMKVIVVPAAEDAMHPRFAAAHIKLSSLLEFDVNSVLALANI